MTTVFWAVLGGLVALLLLSAALMDRNARRRRARVVDSRDIWNHVREGRRDAKMVDNTPLLTPKDASWTAWSKRDHDRH